MIKYAKIIDFETKKCFVGIGSNIKFYKKLGMEKMEVETNENEEWYLKGYLPQTETLSSPQ